MLSTGLAAGDGLDTSYLIGTWIGYALLLLLALLAFQKGLRDRRRTQAQVADSVDEAPAGEVAAWPAQAPVQPAGSNGRVWILLGILLLLLTLSGAARTLLAATDSDSGAAPKASLPPTVTRTVSFPPSLLGLKRNPALTKAARKGAGSDLDGSDLVVYGSPPDMLLLVVSTGPLGDLDAEIRAAQQASKANGATVNNPVDVAAGPLGGKARCWMSVIKGDNGGVCVFADKGSLLVVYATSAASPQQAGQRARTIRAAVLR